MNPHQTLLLDESPCGLFHADEAGKLLRVNGYLAQLVHTDPAILSGAHIDRLLSPASRIILHTHVLPALKRQGSIEHVELSLRSPDAREVDVLLNASRTQPEGEPPLVCGALFPVKEHRELESQLVNAQRLIERLPGLVFQLVFGPDGGTSIPYASAALKELHGVAPESVAESAELFWRSVHPDDRGEVRRGLLEAARSGRAWQARFRTCVDGRTRYLDARAAPQLLPEGGVLFSGYSHDVTEQVRLDEALREKVVAERASEAKTRFLARVSHELRNPLTAILGFAGLLEMESSGLGERARGMVRHLEIAGTQLMELVDDLLDLSHIESGVEALKLAPLDLHVLLSSVVELMRPVADLRSVAFDFEVPPELRVVGDARRLKQAATNLVSNAIKYNRPGGIVFVRAGDEPERGAWFSVRDQGKGLADDEIKNLFQPFNRLGVDASIKGTGLGLVITRTLLEHMGGSIRVSSTPGVGSCFVVELPACTQAR